MVERRERDSSGGLYGRSQGDPYGTPYGRAYNRSQGDRSTSRFDAAQRSASPYGRGADLHHGSGPYGDAGFRGGATSPYSGGGRGGRGGGPRMNRRAFIAAAGGVAVVAALGVVGGMWLTHRAVACTVNDSPREAPRGSTAADLIKRGYAAPSAGDLVSIPDENGDVEVLEAGGGDPYTLTVNGGQVDPATYRLSDGDVLEFADGADVTEEVVQQNTEIPFKAYIPQDGSFLVKVGYVAQWGLPGVSTVETGAVSGRTYDRGVTREPQDFVIACAEHISPSDGRRLVALTFDDGPDPDYTPQYLDILAQHGAKATFFNLGSAVEAGPEYAALSRRCAEEGHQVASHTYGHLDLVKQSAEGVRDDLDRAFAAVSEATGVPTNVMRPPYGNFYGSTFLEYLKAGGDIAYSAYWGVDSEDWRVATNGSGVEDGAQQIIANCTVGLTADSYNGAIVLMHDSGGNRDRDVAALPGLIEAYRSYGYELVTMNELLAACGTFPEWVVSGHAVRPEGAQLPGEATETVYYDPYTFDPMAPDGGTE